MTTAPPAYRSARQTIECWSIAFPAVRNTQSLTSLGGATYGQDAPSFEIFATPPADDAQARKRIARQLRSEAKPLGGTLGERYFIEHRKLDVRCWISRMHSAGILVDRPSSR